MTTNRDPSQRPARARERLIAVVGAAVVLAAGQAARLPVATARPTFSFVRFAGVNRYDTARLIALHDYGSNAPTVLLARDEPGGPAADALAASYLAGNKRAPILLTDPLTTPAETDAALRSLNTKTVIILGGPSAVSPAVESHLTTEGYTTQRIAGANRYDTAKQVVEAAGVAYVASIDGKKTALLANAAGATSPDALAAAPASFAGAVPTLLTTATSTPPETAQALRDLGVQQLFIVGGTAVVSSGQQAAFEAQGLTTVRLAGANRAATAVTVATDLELAKLGFGSAHVNLARGDDSADALAGGPHAGLEKATLQLTLDHCTLDEASTGRFLRDQSSTLAFGHILGGTGAVCEAVGNQATADAGGPQGPPPQAAPGVFSSAGATTPTVSRIDTTGGWFVQSNGASPVTYYFHPNDTFQLFQTLGPAPAGGCTNDSYADFVSRLTAGDAVSGTYSPSGSSTFCLNDQAPLAPGGVTATAGAGTVTVTFSDSATPSVASYVITRSQTIPNTACPPAGPSYTTLATLADPDPADATASTTYSYTDPTVSAGTTYCYAVASVDQTDQVGATATASPVAAHA